MPAGWPRWTGARRWRRCTRRRPPGSDLHVWVDETRPRNQGASLTAWELAQQGVPHTLVADNAGGHLMQRGLVDVGHRRLRPRQRQRRRVQQDRHLPEGAGGARQRRALLRGHAAVDAGPVAARRVAPDPDRGAQRARADAHRRARAASGEWVEVQLAPDGCAAANPAFDVTPAALVSALITERGVVAARPDALRTLAQGGP